MAGAVEHLSIDEFAACCGKVADRLGHGSLQVTLKRCAVLIHADTKRNFHASHDPNGVPWAGLKHREGRPLRDKGILMASATAQGPGHIEFITDTMLVIGTNLDYAAIHQYGGTIHVPEKRRPYPLTPWVFEVGGQKVITRHIAAHTITIPARPFLGFSDALAEKCALVFGDWMIEEMKAA